MRNKVRAVLLAAAVAAVCIQPVTVSAAQETVIAAVNNEDVSKESLEKPAEEADKGADAAKEAQAAKIAAEKAAKKAAKKKAAAEEAAAEAARAEEAARKAAEEAEQKAEEAARIAEEEAAAKEEEIRQEIVDFALQFEGNPYVYGGTSLTNGADCSGFVMSVFQEFGYELPRVAAAQLDSSTEKTVEEMEPGDLVFYGDYGIDHVALYIGDGQIIHASTAATGIKISEYDYRQPAAVGTYLE